jgi:hypothetical protein
MCAVNVPDSYPLARGALPLQGYMIHGFHLCLQAVIGALKDFCKEKQAKRACKTSSWTEKASHSAGIPIVLIIESSFSTQL